MIRENICRYRKDDHGALVREIGHYKKYMVGLPGGSEGKESATMQEIRVRKILGQEDPLEKGMVTHSSILAWRIPWTEGPGGLQFMGIQRFGHN